MQDSDPDYRDYAGNTAHYQYYDQYQRKYRVEPRESDKLILQEIGSYIASASGRSVSILDAGCSNGNLLYHIKGRFSRDRGSPRLAGFDYSADAIASCQSDPDLAGVELFEASICDFEAKDKYDVVAVNAVYYCLDDQHFEAAVTRVAESLKPGGIVVVFDLITDFPGYSLSVLERSPAFPKGHCLAIRNLDYVRTIHEAAGFEDTRFKAFEIPIDLPQQIHADWLTSYTVKTDAKRMLFRGCLYQPWAIFVARKK